MQFKPRPYQVELIERITTTPRIALWVGMGMGKTSSVLTALVNLDLVEDVGKTLVIAPLLPARATWPVEIQKWDHLKHLRVSLILGNLKARMDALDTDADIYVINYEQLPWLVDYLHRNGGWPFKTIVADESTRLKGFRLRQGTKRAKALAQVAHAHCDRFIELTGTPSPNGLVDLWGQAWFLDAGERLGRAFQSFQDRWFRSERVGADPYAVKLVPMPFARDQIEDRLRDVVVSLDAKDWFDIKEPITNIIRVDLPVAARKIYDDMEHELYAQLESDRHVEAFNAASRTVKCLQIAAGAIYMEEGNGQFEVVHDAKIQALESVIEESAGAPVLVAYQFKSDLDRLQRAFPKGRVLDKNPQTIIDWNEGKIPILFAHPASAGHGLNLQDGGNIICFFSHWWNLEEYLQIIERIGPTRQAQAGHDRPVFIHHIIASNTIDELVMERRNSKRSVQDLLLNAMKRETTHA